MASASSSRLSPSFQQGLKAPMTVKNKDSYSRAPRPLPRTKLRSASTAGASESSNSNSSSVGGRKIFARPLSSSRALAKSTVTLRTSTSSISSPGDGKTSAPTSRIPPYPKPPPPPKVVKAPEKRSTLDRKAKISLPNGTLGSYSSYSSSSTSLYASHAAKSRPSSSGSSPLNRTKSAAVARERTLAATTGSLTHSTVSLDAKGKTSSRPQTAPPKAHQPTTTAPATTTKPLATARKALPAHLVRNSGRPPLAPKPAWLAFSTTKRGAKAVNGEREKKVTLPPSPTVSTPPELTDLQMKMKRIFQEILQTEEQYVSDLEHVCKHCIPAMDNVTELPGSLVGKKNKLFINIPQLLELHKGSILPGMRKLEAKPLTLGSVFLDNEEALMGYSEYMSGAHQQEELLHAENESFFSAIQVKLGDKLSLSAYLIKPVQRMTKYKQFLEQIISYANKSTELFGAASPTEKADCVAQLQEALTKVNHVLQRGNDLLSLASLKDYKGNITAEGKLLKVGQLTIIDTLKVKHRRKVFLFENSIIFAKIRRASKSGPTGSDTYQFMSSVRMTELGMRHQIAGHPSWFEITKRKECYQLEAVSVDEKKAWVDEISGLLDSQRKQLRDKMLQTHQGNKPVALYDIPCWGPLQTSQTEMVDSVESVGTPSSSAKPQTNIVSTPKLLQVTIGSPISSRASSREPVYDYPLVTISPPLPCLSGRESSEESCASGEDSSSLSNNRQRGKEAAMEEINVLQVFKLRRYTIPSFPVISVKLRHMEVRRPNKSGVGSLVLDAYLREKFSDPVPSSLPQKIVVYESCVVSVPEFSKAISISSDFRIVRGRGVLVIWDWEWLEQNESNAKG